MTGVIRIGTRGERARDGPDDADRRTARQAAKAEIELVPVTTDGDTLPRLARHARRHRRVRRRAARGAARGEVRRRRALAQGPADRRVRGPRASARCRSGRTPATRSAPATASRSRRCPRAPASAPARPAASRSCCAARPDLDVVDIRGNVDTRLGTGRPSGELDAVVLAAAGLGRLGRLDAVTELLDARRLADRARPGRARHRGAARARRPRARARARGRRPRHDPLPPCSPSGSCSPASRPAARPRSERRPSSTTNCCSSPRACTVADGDEAPDQCARRDPRQPLGRRSGGCGPRCRRSRRRGTPRQRRRRSCTS